MNLDINWLAVIVGTIAHQGLGALWYAVIFRDTWLRAMGMEPAEIEQESPGGEMAFGAVASFMSVLAVALLMTMLEGATLADGLAIGALTGVAFVFAATVMNGMYEQKKPILSVLFGAYYTLGLMIAGAILGAWR